MTVTTEVMAPTHCACGKAFADDATSLVPGYARKADTNEHVCYDCAARDELAMMHAAGKAMLYLTGDIVVPFNGPGVVPPISHLQNVRVTNWTGRISFQVTGRSVGRHNIGGVRTDVWFKDDEGRDWWGYQVGRDTQIVHARRLKVRR
jgi:hypothetical protein